MKNLFFVLVFAFFSTFVYAQPRANQLYLGGGLGLNSGSSQRTQGGVTTDSPTNTSFSFSPAVGYTITDQWLAGIRLTSGITNSFTDRNNGSFNTFFGASFFGRYYIPINEKLYFFPELQIGFTNRDGETTVAGARAGTLEISQFSAGVAPGFGFFPSEHWSLEFSIGFIGYNRTRSVDLTANPRVEQTSSAFGLNVNSLGGNLSLAYYLPLKAQ